MKAVRVVSCLLILFMLTVTSFAAHEEDRPRDPKAIYIYHTYLSDNLIDKKNEKIEVYTLVKGGVGPIEIRVDLMWHYDVAYSWEWQSDPTIIVSAKEQDLPNGLYYFRVSARDGKTEWTEDSRRLTIRIPH